MQCREAGDDGEGTDMLEGGKFLPFGQDRASQRDQFTKASKVVHEAVMDTAWGRHLSSSTHYFGTWVYLVVALITQ